ncbi:MAG TPA: hypothetical protein VJ032_04425 [Thermoanaerobaculia bacterium]|nr:hypothetical protein [Thermoanaerobaculia bacterium]
MTHFLKDTMSDIRGGRQSWRVVTIFSGSSFVISVATYLISNPF